MRFSVIVPVYRTGEYLDRCVRSVLSQSCPDLELILVDDCSPDHCGRLCDEYAALDPRVRVIHMPANVGLGYARNAGLETAQGDFILFLDSDDWLCPEALEGCNALTDADIGVFGTTFVYEKTGKEEARVPQPAFAQTEKEKADIFAMLTQARIFQFAWNKVYRREFLLQSGVLFEKTPLVEDFLFNIALLPKAATVRCMDKALHYYRKPQHETLASKYSPEFFELSKRKFNLEREYLTQANAEEYTDLICQNFVKHLISAVLRNASPAASLSRKEQKALLGGMLRDEVTVSAVTAYAPKSFVYRLLKGWILGRKANMLYLACRIFGLAQK